MTGPLTTGYWPGTDQTYFAATCIVNLLLSINKFDDLKVNSRDDRQTDRQNDNQSA